MRLFLQFRIEEIMAENENKNCEYEQGNRYYAIAKAL